jgi:hypothetical protein
LPPIIPDIVDKTQLELDPVESSGVQLTPSSWGQQPIAPFDLVFVAPALPGICSAGVGK